MHKKRSLLIFCFFLLMLAHSPVHADLGDGAQNPITIVGNDQFTPENGVVSGSGTPSDPYIIENWTIDAQNGNGISIFHTDAYFIIRNCTIFNGVYGIYMLNVTNGRIEN
ncbi:MAG: hypothetical protein QXO54_04490, partial [Candidatus Methanomethylicaceae archaeon]